MQLKADKASGPSPAPPPIGGGALFGLNPDDGHMGPERPLLGAVEALGLEPIRELGLELDRSLTLRVGREQAGAVRRNRDRLLHEPRLHRPRANRAHDLGDPLDVALRLVGEEAERHVQRLGGERTQRRIGERFTLPCEQAVAYPVRQVERHEQPRPRALLPLLGHWLNLRRRPDRKALALGIECAA